MSYSTQRVVSDGSLVLLSVSIGYLERAHIKVFFDNVENDTLWDWVGSTDNQIAFTPAVPNGVEVLVARSTGLSAPYHVFSQGAQFTAESLDEDIAQILYIAQEATEQSLTAEFFQDVNMHGFKLTNVADAVDPQDAMTLGQATETLQPYVDSSAASASAALAYKNAAEIAAASASGFATTATTQAGLASSSAISADASADAAAISETNAANSAFDAASSAASISIPGGKTMVLKDSAGVSYVEGAAGTTAQRPGSPVVGYTRFNTTINADETWSGAAWLVAGNVTQIGAETLTNKTMAAATNTVEARSAPAASYFSNRNKIINGGFTVNQRVYASGAAVGTNLYGHDRWKMAASADTYTFSTTNNSTLVTIPAGKVLRQVIEGINLTTDTYVLSWNGTAQGKIGAGALSASGVTSAITGGTNTTIEFGPGTIENVQFEVGAIPTPFEVKTFDAELAACKRYWESSYSAGVAVGATSTLGVPRTLAVASGASSATISVRFTVPKRSIPTFHSYSPVNGVIDQITDSNTTNRNASFFDIGTTGAVITNAVSTTSLATHTAHWVADAEL